MSVITQTDLDVYFSDFSVKGEYLENGTLVKEVDVLFDSDVEVVLEGVEGSVPICSIRNDDLPTISKKSGSFKIDGIVYYIGALDKPKDGMRDIYLTEVE